MESSIEENQELILSFNSARISFAEEEEEEADIVISLIDITELKKVEKEVKASQKYIRNLIDSSLDMIISVDKNRRIVEFNKAAQETFGYGRDEIIGKYVSILYADPKEGLKIHNITRRTGKFFGEILNKRKNGELFPSYLSSSILLDENDEFIGIMGISRDITEQNKIKKELQKVYAGIETSLNAVFILDMEGLVTYANPSAASMWGYKFPSEMIGSNVLDYWTESSREKAKSIIGTLLEKGKYIGNELTAKKKDGKEFFVEIMSSVIKDESGKPIGMVASFFDITGRKKSEEALIQKQNELESKLKQEILISELASRLNSAEDIQDICKETLIYIAEEIGIKGVCLYIFDPDNKQVPPVFVCSPKICHFNTQDKTFECLFIISEIIKNIEAGKIYYSSNLEELNKKEREHFKKNNIASIYIRPIKTGKKIRGFVSFSDDHEHIWKREERKFFKTITEIISNAWERDYQFHARLNAEKKQTEAVQMAERTSRLASIGTLAAGISHEINQPLNALKLKVDGMLYWGEREPETLKKNLLENLQNISEQAKRIEEIIKQMRVLARQEKGKDPIPLNLNKIVKEVFSLMKQRISSHGIKIEFNLEDSLPFVYGYPTQMEQVIINLLNNAINALDTVAKKNKMISITTEFSDNNCVLKIFDNGPGIPDEDINQIFDPFYTSNINGEGMGFGLSIIQNIITGMGGTIIAENHEECGALFKISIPVLSKNESG